MFRIVKSPERYSGSSIPRVGSPNPSRTAAGSDTARPTTSRTSSSGLSDARAPRQSATNRSRSNTVSLLVRRDAGSGGRPAPRRGLVGHRPRELAHHRGPDQAAQLAPVVVGAAEVDAAPDARVLHLRGDGRERL